jgi:TonB family protein
VTLADAWRDLVAFTAQGILVTAVAAVLARVLPIHRPALKLAWWHAVLVAVLGAPLLGRSGLVPSARIEIQTWMGPFASSASVDATGRSYGAEAAAVVLAVGALVNALRILRGTRRLRLCRARAVPFDSPALSGLETAIGARADVRLSPDVAVPATFGLRRPLVLLPEGVRGMAAERQRAIVAHELIHVRRRDWPVAVLEESLAAVLWFHPAVHVLLGRIRLAREQCVDAAVVLALGARRAYLESLLEVAARRLRPEPVPAALFLGERHLSERVELLLKEVVMSKVRAVCHLSVSGLLLVLAGALAASSFPLSASAQPEEGTKSAAAEKSKAGEPRMVHKVNPVYPPEAKKDGIQGFVHIDARIAKDGTVAEAAAKDGHPTLAEAALAAVRQWRYEPVLGADKKPVEVKITITVNFRLAESQS